MNELLSPSAELYVLLGSIDFPATVDDLVREARREDLPLIELNRLAELEPRSYSGKFDVLTELRKRHSSQRTRRHSLQPRPLTL